MYFVVCIYPDVQSGKATLTSLFSSSPVSIRSSNQVDQLFPLLSILSQQLCLLHSNLFEICRNDTYLAIGWEACLVVVSSLWPLGYTEGWLTYDHQVVGKGHGQVSSPARQDAKSWHVQALNNLLEIRRRDVFSCFLELCHQIHQFLLQQSYLVAMEITADI